MSQRFVDVPLTNRYETVNVSLSGRVLQRRRPKVRVLLADTGKLVGQEVVIGRDRVRRGIGHFLDPAEARRGRFGAAAGVPPNSVCHRISLAWGLGCRASRTAMSAMARTTHSK